MHQEYVCGFMFDALRHQVALIEKLKPKWQAGMLNGIGGKIEEGEDWKNAMSREFLEETGVLHGDWVKFLVYAGVGCRVHFCRAFTDKMLDVITMEEEKVVTFGVRNIPREKTIYSLNWLIPLALDRDVAPLTIMIEGSFQMNGGPNEM